MSDIKDKFKVKGVVEGVIDFFMYNIFLFFLNHVNCVYCTICYTRRNDIS